MRRPRDRRFIPEPIDFDWDAGNSEKNWIRHRVSQLEAEAVFFNRPHIFFPDQSHSKKELRFYCLGKTSQDRLLFVSFTIRDSKVRIISARDMNSRESEEYQSYEKVHSQF